MQTKHFAIMLTDIKGFTSRTSSSSRAEMMDLLSKHQKIVMPVIKEFNGSLVKTIGDAFLVTFESPTDSVLCGISIQDKLKEYNKNKEGGERIEIRIAINSGEVAIGADNDIYGDAVNITSRLESIVEAGEVFFTEAVYLAMNKKEVPSSEIGYRQFKGIPEKIKVFKVLRETPVGKQSPEIIGENAIKRPSPKKESSDGADVSRAGFWRRLSSLLLDGLFLLIIGSSLGLKSCGSRAEILSGQNRVSKNIAIENVKISRRGIEIKGEKGELIKVGKTGVTLSDPASLESKLIKADKTKFNIGIGSNKKKFPLLMLFWVIYCGIFMWRFGATPGMKILKLKIVKNSTRLPAGADEIFLRALFSLVSSFFLLGYAWALIEKEKRTWHDIISGTKIIRI